MARRRSIYEPELTSDEEDRRYLNDFQAKLLKRIEAAEKAGIQRYQLPESKYGQVNQIADTIEQNIQRLATANSYEKIDLNDKILLGYATMHQIGIAACDHAQKLLWS